MPERAQPQHQNRTGWRLAPIVAVVLFAAAAPVPAAAQDSESPDVFGMDERVIELEARIVSLEARIVDVSPAPIPQGVAVPSDVLFAFGSAELADDAKRALDEVASTLADAPAGTVTVIGHTDSVGDDASNQTLSEARAGAVVAYLESAVGRGDLTFDAQGRGESEPVAPNEVDGQDNPDGRRQNRRVEVIIPG